MKQKETAKLIRLVKALILFSSVALLGCGSSNRGNDGGGASNITPTVKSDSIIISAIDVRPNPLHIWPNPSGEGCSIVVSIKNIGEAACTDELVFNAYFSKADNTLNNSFGPAQATSIGGEWKNGLLSGETAYVQMSMSGWVTLVAASSASKGENLNSTNKVTIKAYRQKNAILVTDHISDSNPETIFQIIDHR